MEQKTYTHTNTRLYLDLNTTTHRAKSAVYRRTNGCRVAHSAQTHNLQPNDCVPLMVATFRVYVTTRASYTVPSFLFFSFAAFTIHPSDERTPAATGDIKRQKKRKFHGAPRQRLCKQNLKLNTFALNARKNVRIKRWYTDQRRSHNVSAFEFSPFSCSEEPLKRQECVRAVVGPIGCTSSLHEDTLNFSPAFAHPNSGWFAHQKYTSPLNAPTHGRVKIYARELVHVRRTAPVRDCVLQIWPSFGQYV